MTTAPRTLVAEGPGAAQGVRPGHRVLVHNQDDVPVRFDVAEVLGEAGGVVRVRDVDGLTWMLGVADPTVQVFR